MSFLFFKKILYIYKRKIYKSQFLDNLYCKYLRSNLKNKNFTIISNNCWAGSVYEDLKLEYTTPTVGLFFFAPCYIKFLKRIEYYLSVNLTFKENSFYDDVNESRKNTNDVYPIGILDDIEIHFLHYKNEQIAYEKWMRRSRRVNFDNLYIVFSDRDKCCYEHIKEFDQMPFKNKIFFSSKIFPEFRSLIWLKHYKNDSYIGDIVSNKWRYRFYFNVVDWLNG